MSFQRLCQTQATKVVGIAVSSFGDNDVALFALETVVRIIKVLVCDYAVDLSGVGVNGPVSFQLCLSDHAPWLTDRCSRER